VPACQPPPISGMAAGGPMGARLKDYEGSSVSPVHARARVTAISRTRFVILQWTATHPPGRPRACNIRPGAGMGCGTPRARTRPANRHLRAIRAGVRARARVRRPRAVA
jgi:hypothetical protein